MILADEPTGNLDSKTSKEILELLRELNAQGKTVVIITHDNEVARACDRVILIRDGRVADQKPIESASVLTEPSIPHLPALGIKTLIKESLPRAWDNLRRNRLRSLLTMLGVVVGVASILSMLTLGTFTKEKILKSYATLGVNTLMFQAYPNWMMKAVDMPPNPFSSLNLERDVYPLQKVFPEIKAVSPWYLSYRHSAVYGGRSVQEDVSVVGVSEHGLPITRREIALGVGLLPVHIENKSSVCVIGFELAQKLFQRQNPIGEAIQVSVEDLLFSCRVIGVSKPVFSRANWGKPDLQVIVPYTYYLTLPMYSYYRNLFQLAMEVEDNGDVEATGKKVQALFTKRYGKSGIFKASNDSVLVSQMRRFLDMFTLLLVSIAALSLIVGEWVSQI